MSGLSLAHASEGERSPDPFGQNRLLVMCLPNDREISRDEKSFIYRTDWDGFAERDLLLIGLNEQIAYNFLAQDIKNDSGSTGLKSQYIYRKPIEAKAIRKRVNCIHDFEIVLVGKDTGIKARWTNSFMQEDLFRRIDSMPMRRFEMRQQKEKN